MTTSSFLANWSDEEGTAPGGRSATPCKDRYRYERGDEEKGGLLRVEVADGRDRSSPSGGVDRRRRGGGGKLASPSGWGLATGLCVGPEVVMPPAAGSNQRRAGEPVEDEQREAHAAFCQSRARRTKRVAFLLLIWTDFERHAECLGRF